MFNETAISNPFPGLRAFEEDEDVLFFGREKQVDELVTKLRTTRFIAVIGSSGSGKSSLIKSGLIPSLQSGFMSGAGSSWRICSFRPGNNPIGNLANALVIPGVLDDGESEEEPEIQRAITESTIRRSSSGLVEVYKQSGIPINNNLLILVDQFEEIFRFSKFESDSKDGKRDSVAFINLLLKATSQKDFPIYIVFTMRSDFLSDCTAFRGLPEAINSGNYLVPRMTREERKEAITGPIAVANGKISQRLLNLLLNDVGDNPDQLPILQHSLMRTWDLWKKKGNKGTEIDFVEYEAIGTMKLALSQHAEEAYDELKTDKDRRICENIFKTLTDKGSDSRGIRRPSRMSELCAISNASYAEVLSVVEVFRKEGRGFLMPPQNIPITESTIIDISHESIMRVWERLIHWVDEENQSASTYIRLCEAADLYELGNGGLWRDPELQVAWKWKEDQIPNNIWASRYNNNFEKAILFLTHSKDQSEQEKILKESRQKKRLKTARRVIIVIACFGVMAFFLSIYSFDQRNKAVKSEQIANTEKVKAEKQKKIAEDNKLIALEQKGVAEKSREEALKEKEIANRERKNAVQSQKNALMQKGIAEDQKANADRERERAQDNENLAVEQSKRAKEQMIRANENADLANSEKMKANRLKDLSDSRNLAYQSILLLNEGKFNESKELVEKAYELNNINNGPKQNSDIYNALNLNWEKSINNKNKFLVHKYPVRAITGKANSDIIISADESGMVIISRSVDGVLQPITNFSVKGEIRNLSLSPNGQKLLVLTAKEGGFLYGFDEQKKLFPLLSIFSYEGVGKTAFFVNELETLVLTSSGIIKLGIENNAIKVKEFIKGSSYGSMVKAKSGKVYISNDNKINVYNSVNNISKSPDFSYSLKGQITSLAIDNSEDYLAAGSADGIIWLTNFSSKSRPISLALHQSSISDLKFGKISGNRLQLASAGKDQSIKLIDVKANFSGNALEDVLILKGHNLWVYALYYLSNGKYLFSVSEDQNIIGWVSTMADIRELLKKSK
jgi:WD40 repeat protein/energy-coupling factor transporter ATP-binding protein EcfA2